MFTAQASARARALCAQITAILSYAFLRESLHWPDAVGGTHARTRARTHANQSPLLSTFGTLDAKGNASVSFTLPPGFSPGLAGTAFHHAYVVIKVEPGLVSFPFVSEALPLTLVP